MLDVEGARHFTVQPLKQHTVLAVDALDVHSGRRSIYGIEHSEIRLHRYIGDAE
jgi:hypothetical protein